MKKQITPSKIAKRYIKIKKLFIDGGREYWVYLRVEEQSFIVGYPRFRTIADARRFRKMLAKALAKMVEQLKP